MKRTTLKVPEDNSRQGDTKPGLALKTLGGYMVGLCLICLIIGRLIVRILFPEVRGQGIPPGMWFVLIPIWSIGLIGLVLLLVGWVRGKAAKPAAPADGGRDPGP